jgi:hypothetical protein
LRQQRASIDPDDPVACSQWAISPATKVAGLTAVIRQSGAAGILSDTLGTHGDSLCATSMDAIDNVARAIPSYPAPRRGP